MRADCFTGACTDVEASDFVDLAMGRKYDVMRICMGPRFGVPKVRGEDWCF